jgi:hypothetical protein
MNVEWGQAEHVGGGELLWGQHTPLPMTSAGLIGAGNHNASLILSGQRTDESRFDAGEEPGLAFGLRHPGDKKLDVPPAD